MKIGLFIPSLFKYDAMGNDVLSMYKIIKEDLKVDVIIYANDFDRTIEAEVFHISESEDFLKNPHNLLIYHHGVYTDFFDKLANANCKKIFRYHNITYPDLFEGYDDIAVEICENGRKQMYQEVNKFDYFLSCSNFNNEELVNNFSIDRNKTYILPPFHRVEEWINIQENTDFISENINKNKTNILTVGRLSPNKNHQTLIKAFADYISNYNKEAILHIVGKIGPKKYYDEILDLIYKLGIERKVKLYTNGLEESKLKSLYLNADIGIITSKHEGFCVPIVEFMYFGIPIVSSSFTALKDTVGIHGLSIDNDDYIEFSIALKYAEKFNSYLKKISKDGYKQYCNNTMKKNFISYLKYILSKL